MRSSACARSAGGLIPEAIIPEPAFEIFKFDTRSSAAGRCAVMPRARLLSFRSSEVLAAITPRHASRVSHQPQQSDRRCRCRWRPFATIARRPCLPEAIVFVDEAYAEFSGDDVHPRAAVVSERDRRPDVLEGVRPGRACDRAAWSGAAERLDPDSPGDSGLQRQHRRRCRRCAAALDDLAYVEDYLRQVEESKALLYAACDRLGLCTTGRSAANFVLVSRRRSHGDALVNGAARARHLHPRPARRNRVAPAASASLPASSSTHDGASR